jgi:hypothetical protein
VSAATRPQWLGAVWRVDQQQSDWRHRAYAENPLKTGDPDAPKARLSGMVKIYAETNCFRHSRFQLLGGTKNCHQAFTPWTQTGKIPPEVEVGDALLAGLLRDGFYLSQGGVENNRPPAAVTAVGAGNTSE